MFSIRNIDVTNFFNLGAFFSSHQSCELDFIENLTSSHLNQLLSPPITEGSPQLIRKNRQEFYEEGVTEVAVTAEVHHPPPRTRQLEG